MHGETCRFSSKFPHKINCKDYKVAVKKSRICKGNNRKKRNLKKKRIFKQKGGILHMLLPFAAKATAPLAGSLLSAMAGKLLKKKLVFKKSILISNDIWEKVKSNNNNFSSIKKKKKSSPPSIKKPKLQEEQKEKLPTIPKHSVRYALNERAKECRKNQI